MVIKVLIVDDEEGNIVRRNLASFKDDQGTKIDAVVVKSANHAIDALSDQDFDVAVVDMVMPDPEVDDDEAGLRVVEAIRASGSDTQAIVLTGHVSSENTVRAMEAGAFSYIDKASDSWRILPLKVRLAAERKHWRKERLEAERRGMLAKAIQEIVHDMNNTLAPIIGFVDVALKRTHEAAQDMQEYLGYVQLGAQRLNGMKEDILTVGGPAQLKLQRAAFPISEELRVQQPFFVQICRERACDFQLETVCEGEFHVDGPRLVRAVENLVSNAARAVKERHGSGPGGFVSLTVCEETDCLCIRVEDNGIGMGAELREKILEPESYGDHIKGHGIGLQASKRTIELHGGTLEVESEPNVGTTFTIRIPDHRPQ